MSEGERWALISAAKLGLLGGGSHQAAWSLTEDKGKRGKSGPMRDPGEAGVSKAEASMGNLVRRCLTTESKGHTPLSPAPRGRGRGISEFKASLVYRTNSRTARVVKQRNPV